MKKRLLTVITIAALLILTGCASTAITEPQDGGVGMFPLRQIQVSSIEDLQSDSYRILGTVSGTGNVSLDDPSDGDTHAYGTLELDEAARMYYQIDQLGTDPYEIALANAVNALIVEARSMGAHFVTFPSYTVEHTEDQRVIVTVSAVAVELVAD